MVKTQNKSAAVMNQRVEPLDSLDMFPTPAWATRALCEWIRPKTTDVVWEPACGAGHMSKPLKEYFGEVISTDIHPYGYGEVHNFLNEDNPLVGCRWIITNPPFKLAEEFALKALYYPCKPNVALFVRTNFVESKSRYENLFTIFPPTNILQFVERVPLIKGRVNPKAVSATAYCWIVWRHNSTMYGRTFFEWIEPCRKYLEKPGDYVC